MPLGKLTDPDPSFMLLGRIKKGAPKNGENSIGKDLDHWRFVYKPGKDQARVQECIEQVYGKDPRDVNIRLAFDTIQENWDANLECYKAGVLVAKCAMTEERGYYWLNYRDGAKVLVRDGMPVGEEGVEFMKKPIDPTQPIYYSKNKNEPAYMEPYGRLRVVVPELAALEPPVVGWFEVVLKSPRDIRQVSAELKAIALKAKESNSPIFGIPMRLSRIEEDITKNINGNLTRGPSWMVHIALTGEWGSKALEYVERKALPEWVDGKVVDAPQLPAGPDWDNPDWENELPSEFDPEFLEGESKAVVREPDVPVMSAKFLVEEGLMDNLQHAAGVVNLLQMDGAPVEAGKARFKLYEDWRAKYPRKDKQTREFCALKARNGEIPE